MRWAAGSRPCNWMPWAWPRRQGAAGRPRVAPGDPVPAAPGSSGPTGVAGLLGHRPGPKGRHKFTAPKQAEAQRLLDAGSSIRATAATLGLSEALLRHALQRGELHRPAGPRRGLGPRERSDQDVACPGGLAVHRETERALAATGQLPAAAPRFAVAEAVRGGGVLCALPALVHLGLLTVGERVYGRLRAGFYGLQTILLTLACMALLRVRSPRTAGGHRAGRVRAPPGSRPGPRGEDPAAQAPGVGRPPPGRRLPPGPGGPPWVAQDPEAVGVLYVDGHVRPYHGHQHRLSETHVARRRLCLPATTNVFVNDPRRQPRVPGHRAGQRQAPRDAPHGHPARGAAPRGGGPPGHRGL